MSDTAMATHCLSPARAAGHAIVAPTSYARLFPDLPSFEADESFLYALGRVGGLCDCRAMSDSGASLGSEAAGWPFFGQFVAHDITADRSVPGAHLDPSQLRNARSPKLNLECVYGDGPIGHPFLYQRKDPAKLLTSSDGSDLLRNREGTAVIGDPRNDSHVVMSQMHLAFVRAHNVFVDRARSDGVSESLVYETASRELRWHYQTAVLREFLPSLIGQEAVDALLGHGRRFYRPVGEAYIPVEFADAAYRYGHAQIRHTYTLNAVSRPVPIFPDLIGFRPVPADLRVEWPRFFDDGVGGPAQRAKKIDGRLIGALLALPVALTGACDVEELHSLAVRDLERGQGVGLPSGEAIAAHIGAVPLTAGEIGAEPAGWHRETPLWYYILREADVRCGGNRLGPVGALIVGDVLVGLLDLDSTSVRHAPASWRPRASLIQLLTTT